LHQTKWENGQTWEQIIDGYVKFVKKNMNKDTQTIVVFDGYNCSTKDHAHRRRQKQSCHSMKINIETTPFVTKDIFLSNSQNKAELIIKLADEFRNHQIHTVHCRDDADTQIVKECLHQSMHGTVDVRAEDADILVMLVHHYNIEKHNLITVKHQLEATA